MFIELHKLDGTTITINLDKLEYFVPVDNGKHTMISVPSFNGFNGFNGWLYVEESYDKVKELIIECQKK